jgi:hypothetical protein
MRLLYARLFSKAESPENQYGCGLATYLDDAFHEFARLGENVEAMPD